MKARALVLVLAATTAGAALGACKPSSVGEAEAKGDVAWLDDEGSPSAVEALGRLADTDPKAVAALEERAKGPGIQPYIAAWGGVKRSSKWASDLLHGGLRDPTRANDVASAVDGRDPLIAPFLPDVEASLVRVAAGGMTSSLAGVIAASGAPGHDVVVRRLADKTTRGAMCGGIASPSASVDARAMLRGVPATSRDDLACVGTVVMLAQTDDATLHGEAVPGHDGRRARGRDQVAARRAARRGRRARPLLARHRDAQGDVRGAAGRREGCGGADRERAGPRRAGARVQGRDVSAAASLAPARARLERMLAEKDVRNRDNVARTESYLELYALARAHGVELPWVLMAHLVSRNAGYLMTDLAPGGRAASFFTRDALDELFLFLERANYLIFDDAWHHVMHHALGRTGALDARTPRFMREAWGRYEDATAGGVTAAAERALVMDLVTNEQNLIEHRVVHNARFERARAMVAFFEEAGIDGPVVLPVTAARIRVGNFARLERRIEAGKRIFDEGLAETHARSAIFAWAAATRHTGSRAAYKEGASDVGLREGWPVERVRGLWRGVHGAPEADPTWA